MDNKDVPPPPPLRSPAQEEKQEKNNRLKTITGTGNPNKFTSSVGALSPFASTTMDGGSKSSVEKGAPGNGTTNEMGKPPILIKADKSGEKNAEKVETENSPIGIRIDNPYATESAEKVEKETVTNASTESKQEAKLSVQGGETDIYPKVENPANTNISSAENSKTPLASVEIQQSSEKNSATVMQPTKTEAKPTVLEGAQRASVATDQRKPDSKISDINADIKDAERKNTNLVEGTQTDKKMDGEAENRDATNKGSKEEKIAEKKDDNISENESSENTNEIQIGKESNASAEAKKTDTTIATGKISGNDEIKSEVPKLTKTNKPGTGQGQQHKVIANLNTGTVTVNISRANIRKETASDQKKRKETASANMEAKEQNYNQTDSTSCNQAPGAGTSELTIKISSGESWIKAPEKERMQTSGEPKTNDTSEDEASKKLKNGDNMRENNNIATKELTAKLPSENVEKQKTDSSPLPPLDSKSENSKNVLKVKDTESEMKKKDDSDKKKDVDTKDILVTTTGDPNETYKGEETLLLDRPNNRIPKKAHQLGNLAKTESSLQKAEVILKPDIEKMETIKNKLLDAVTDAGASKKGPDAPKDTQDLNLSKIIRDDRSIKEQPDTFSKNAGASEEEKLYDKESLKDEARIKKRKPEKSVSTEGEGIKKVKIQKIKVVGEIYDEITKNKGKNHEKRIIHPVIPVASIKTVESRKRERPVDDKVGEQKIPLVKIKAIKHSTNSGVEITKKKKLKPAGIKTETPLGKIKVINHGAVNSAFKQVKKEDKKSSSNVKAAKEKNGKSDTVKVDSQKRRIDSTDPGIEERIRSGTIKRIMKIDKDVKITAAEAVFMASKATELFLGKMMTTVHEDALSKAKKGVIQYSDLAKAVKKHAELGFLEDILPEV